MNTQPIEKSIAQGDGRFLDLHSIFFTIQGEGPFTGRPAVFVRLAGCNLQCPLCDTQYIEGRCMTPREAILERVMELRPKPKDPFQPRPLVVITGGEPFRQNIWPLTVQLNDEGYDVQVETNGTLPPPSNMANTVSSVVELSSRRRNVPHAPGNTYVVCSPKTGKVNPITASVACAFKYVAREEDLDFYDGLPLTALDHTAAPFLARPPEGFAGTVYLQPCDEKDEEANARNTQACVESCMAHGYTLQLQLHKILNME